MLKTKKHFTIIELLVVIAIISILAALILGGISSARESARQTQAKTDIQMLVGAIESYKSIYKSFPIDTPSSDDTTDLSTASGGDDGLLAAIQGTNARNQVFYKKNGSEIKDPWGGTYSIHLDTNYNNNMTAGEGSPVSGVVAIYTTAKDGEFIRSWTNDVD